MTQEEVQKEILASDAKNLMLEFPTGYGKSKLALDIVKKRIKEGKDNAANRILVVYPRKILKDNWKDEIKKWGMDNYIYFFTTYRSLPKYAGYWSAVIFDECHHLTDACFESLKSFNIKTNIFLSATINKQKKWDIRREFGKVDKYVIPIREAIEDTVLPDPKVYLLPLNLSTKECSETFQLNKFKNPVQCTPKTYYEKESKAIEWLKLKAKGSIYQRNLWLHRCGERLRWLSNQKNEIVLEILSKLSRYRTLTFCNSINQTELLGKNPINSKNKESKDILEKFNEGKIKHITSVAMLDEGMNLKNCQIGIYANLNSSERIVKQRLGRILRHKKPVIIIPYFVDTRDEEIVNQMLEDYNPELVNKIQTINDIAI